MYFAKQNQFPDVDPVALESKGRALAALVATVKETEGVVQSKEAEARDLQVYGRYTGDGRGGERELREGGREGERKRREQEI